MDQLLADRVASSHSASTSGAWHLPSASRSTLSTKPGLVSSQDAARRCLPILTAVATEARPQTPKQQAAKLQSPRRLENFNQNIRDGDFEADLMQRQAEKSDGGQPTLASSLPPFDAASVAEACIVGCGPAGLALAAELASRGVAVVLVGHDRPFVNNYGVWTDEFRELGLEHTLESSWRDALCYFGEESEVRIQRSYSRVCRRKLRQHLLDKCVAAGVRFQPGEVHGIDSRPGADVSTVSLESKTQLRARLITLAAGQAAGKFLQYEKGAPTVGVQTAYGIEADVEGYGDAYDAKSMLFMDFRRHHSGMWDDTGLRPATGEHPAGGDGLWGTGEEVPSFLYAMRLPDGSVFLEETCLVAKPALPFATLKRRLHRRLAAMGIKVRKVHEEEWSYIPVGGPLPSVHQGVTAFGAAANLVHPATGYSIVRSLREAPALADSIAQILKLPGMSAEATAHAVWDALWPQEKRRQAAFHVFGMELLARLDLGATNDFFATFFRLPDSFWRGFLASQLSSSKLVGFALLTFVLAPTRIRWYLVRHFLSHPAGIYMLRTYAGASDPAEDQAAEESQDAIASPAP